MSTIRSNNTNASSVTIENQRGGTAIETAVNWIRAQLSALLATEATEDIVRYVLAMGNARDIEEYMCDLLDASDPRVKPFISELLSRWNQLQCTKTINRKEEVENPVQKTNKQKKIRKSRENECLTKIVGDQQDSNYNFKLGADVVGDVQSSDASTNFPNNTCGPTSKKKANFVPLFSTEGHERTVAKLPGRHVCDCQAMKHSLINNCLKCGRIVCDQEGSGPCLFCKTLVCTREEQEVLSRNTKKSERLREQLMSKDSSKTAPLSNELDKAVEHKNRLLEFDRTSAKRTQVIDDESDYFATDSNQWLNQSERQALSQRESELRKQRHESRLDRRVTLDFAGRRVVEDTTLCDMYNPNDPIVQAVNFALAGTAKSLSGYQLQVDCNPDNFNGGLVNPRCTIPPPKFISSDYAQSKKFDYAPVNTNKVAMRVQDAELQQMSDNGVALSMHQPWASLLIAGIKTHEGRSWYTSHRGVLWIASTVRQPTSDEIDATENQYRVFNNPSHTFPHSYPTSSLLGCVDVVDCLAQDDYRKQFPHGESDSQYVLICQNTRELSIKFPIKGRHKIYKLDSELHKAAKKGILMANIIR